MRNICYFYATKAEKDIVFKMNQNHFLFQNGVLGKVKEETTSSHYLPARLSSNRNMLDYTIHGVVPG